MGFEYVAGSTRGVTTAEPDVTVLESEPGGPTYQELMWNLTSLKLKLAPGESRSLTFDAEVSVATGNYCNRAWVDPGGKKTSSGPTAKIVVGNPEGTVCPGEAATVSKSVDPDVAPGNTATTYTYTIEIQNIGTEALNMSQVRDLLPEGFAYVPGSTSGDVTIADPTTTMHQGSERLDWSFDPSFLVPSGDTRTIVFLADATAEPGDFWNQVWVTFDEFVDKLYSWPTAPVTVMGVFETAATDGQATVDSELWIGAWSTDSRSASQNPL